MAATASTAIAAPFLPLTETEAGVLALYDRLQQLQFELALLDSRREHHVQESDISRRTEDDLAVGQAQLLEARATLDLRNSVVENVVAVQPILNAVHRATQASPAERDLEPFIERRDAVASHAATLSSDLDTARSRLAELEAESLRVRRRNVDLASEVLRWTARASEENTTGPTGGQFEDEISSLEDEVKVSRRRWRIMKGAASAMVAGSGVDWVRDPPFRNLVLDPPE